MVSYRNNLVGKFVLLATWNMDNIHRAGAVDISTVFTQTAFDNLAPGAGAPYTYTGFLDAVTNWNTKNPSNAIFAGSTEMQQRHELAAFLGNALHESDAFQASREYFMCSTTQESTGNLYCQLPSTQFDTAAEQYCSTTHTNPATSGYEDGCNCLLQSPDATLGGTYVDANKLFFGRGALQLSWNYNYIDASKALTGSADVLCNSPDLVATNETYAWGTAFWFWTMNTGSVGKTCSAAVLTDGDFGGTVNTINGAIECPAGSSHESSLAQRLNYYCKAATELSVDALLTLADCNGLQTAFDACATASGACSDCVTWLSTKSPTFSPTKSPTDSPVTSPPSKAPTKAPTNPPTTAAPTKNPVKNPTVSPSTSPSASPTRPTTSPTKAPTNPPTTLAPTKSPVKNPTMSPSTPPTASPTRPTTSPTKAPTKVPTKSPVASPTPKPTNRPTSNPTTTAEAGTSGTMKFYPNWGVSPARCTMDCDPATDPMCGGIISNPTSMRMYDTAQACCAFWFGWMDNARCVALTTGDSTNKWWVDYSTSSCKQDCLTSTASSCGGAPTDLSMKLYDTVTECCSKLGWIQPSTCAAVSTSGPESYTGTQKFHADWTAGTCKKDCPVSEANPECGGILTNTAGETLFDTAKDCCASKFGWIDSDYCQAIATGGHTNKYYVSYSDNACKKDCAVSESSPECGGNPTDQSSQLFAAASECCASKLSWVNLSACVSKSETGSAAAATGSGKWYVDWSISKCVKDCPESALDSECGGLAESWESTEYSSASECCSTRLKWMDLKSCKRS
eukprot:CCRYP_019581-RA/>CCRYP_019581-RA protein AED:0.06 eAED:0.06 QI:137/1/1/1/1/1/6/278/792